MIARWIVCLLCFGFTGLASHRPAVAISSPTHGTTVLPGLVRVSAEASDPEGIVRVQYYVNGVADESFTTPPYEHFIFVTSGRHEIRAHALNTSGATNLSAPILIQVGEHPVNLRRGPYLQSCTTTSIVVRWRTDWPTNSVVRFGATAGSLPAAVTNHTRTSEHEVTITGLVPGTRSFYSIGTDTQTFAGGPGTRFHTAPTNARPVQVWVIGDSGTADSRAAAVYRSYTNRHGLFGADLWLMLGDNAYENGTYDEYQRAVFDLYPELLRTTPLWPTIGNHEIDDTGEPRPHLDFFTLPTAGQAGGVASGTEKYFSFDYANVHFICLDSQSSSRAEDGPMLTWLREDLAATDKDWIVAFWHHPPYSFGSHDSDVEFELVQMREGALPILEAGGADLVLAGHSHVYERSALLNGHYGPSFSLTAAMVLDAGDGRQSGYRKPAGGIGEGQGTVYAVCGVSGQGGSGTPFRRHPAMVLNTNVNGSMILRFDGLVLNVEFLRTNGVVADAFTINKSQPTTLRPTLGIVRTMSGISLSWPTSQPTFAPERLATLGTGQVWTAVEGTRSQIGRRNVLHLDASAPASFFRLKRQ
jgi:hypothetical protein